MFYVFAPQIFFMEGLQIFAPGSKFSVLFSLNEEEIMVDETIF